MARSYQVTVGPNKVVLADSKTKGGGPIVRVSNPTGAATSLYIGGDENEVPASSSQGALTVSTSTGYIIGVGGSETFVLDGQEAIYGITNTNTLTVYVFRTGS